MNVFSYANFKKCSGKFIISLAINSYIGCNRNSRVAPFKDFFGSLFSMRFKLFINRHDKLTSLDILNEPVNYYSNAFRGGLFKFPINRQLKLKR